jgi:ATP-binding cassette subfamily F protein 3
VLGGEDFSARARGVAAQLGLSAEQLEQPRGTMSGGEVARAALTAILLSRFDVLLLDEPTNHLDLEAIEQLEFALESYEGSIVLVTHYHRFLERLQPTRRLELG